MKPVSLADITYEQGLQLIAMRKQAIDSGKIRRMTKEALDNSYMLRDVGTEVFEKAAEGGWMDSIKSTLSGLGDKAQQGLQQVGDYAGQAGDALKKQWHEGINAPTRDILTKGMIGAGVGGLGGLGASAINGEGHWGRNALMGGIAGGAMGGGLGLMQNPEAAEAIQNKFRSMMNTQDRKAPADPGGAAAPAGVAAAKSNTIPDRSDTDARSSYLRDIEDPELQMSALDSERNTAESYMPDALYGAGAAGTVAGTGYGLRKLHNMKQYHPEALAEMILNNTGKVNTESLERLVADIPEFSAKLGLKPQAQKAKELNRLIGSLRSEGDVGVKKLTEWLSQNKNTNKSILGNARNPRFLDNFVPDEKLRKNLFSSGLKRRPGRIGAALSLLGLGAAGLTSLGKGWNNAVTQRSHAQEVLDDLRRKLQAQQQQ